jgi:hypothetical protein
MIELNKSFIEFKEQKTAGHSFRIELSAIQALFTQKDAHKQDNSRAIKAYLQIRKTRKAQINWRWNLFPAPWPICSPICTSMRLVSSLENNGIFGPGSSGIDSSAMQKVLRSAWAGSAQEICIGIQMRPLPW